jgi:hypothetical protein
LRIWRTSSREGGWEREAEGAGGVPDDAPGGGWREAEGEVSSRCRTAVSKRERREEDTRTEEGLRMASQILRAPSARLGSTLVDVRKGEEGRKEKEEGKGEESRGGREEGGGGEEEGDGGGTSKHTQQLGQAQDPLQIES